jgi:hypothetical protein
LFHHGKKASYPLLKPRKAGSSRGAGERTYHRASTAGLFKLYQLCIGSSLLFWLFIFVASLVAASSPSRHSGMPLMPKFPAQQRVTLSITIIATNPNARFPMKR